MSTGNSQLNGGAQGNSTIEPSDGSGTQSSVIPRDVRLLHLIFATQGIQNYEDHVPLQLMDFAHSKFQHTHQTY